MKSQKSINKDSDEFDIDDLKYFKSLSVKQKLDHLEKLQELYLKITPKKAKEKNSKLKQMGF